MFLSLLLATAQAAPPLSAELSYYGESLIHPGLSAGLEMPLHTRVNRWGGTRTLFAGADVGGWHHNNSNTTLFTEAELGLRKTHRSGFKVELISGLGVLRSFNGSPTYTADGEQVLAAGQSGVMPSLALGFGQDLSRKHDLPISWHVRPTLFIQAPYNASFAPNLAVEAGLTWRIGS